MPGKKGQRGGRRKPTQSKILQGTWRKDRANPDEPQYESGLPKPPSYLDKRAREVWRQRGSYMNEQGTMKLVFEDTFGIYCQGVSDMERLARLVRKQGEKIDGKRNPLTLLLREARDLVSRTGASFGLNPADCSRVKAQPKPRPATAQEKFLARRRERS